MFIEQLSLDNRSWETVEETARLTVWFAKSFRDNPHHKIIRGESSRIEIRRDHPSKS